MTALTTEELERIERDLAGPGVYPRDVRMLLAEVRRLSAQLQRCNTACDEAKRNG